jgi:hypothetical protein
MSTAKTPVDDALALFRRQFSEQIAALLTPEQRADVVRVFQLIAAREGEPLARAWMLGMNPHLGDENPILVIRDGRTREVEGAARAYLDGVWT